MSFTAYMKPLSGGEFLVKELKAEDIFIAENLNEEQAMIAATCQEFVEQKVLPVLNRIDTQEAGLLQSLLEQAGELGLLSLSIPEAYGGFDKDLVTAMLVGEKTGPAGSFSIAMMVHSGVGSLPIVYYGNEEQKQKYLPKLASGQWKGAYCLTEPGAGSDANAGKTKATLSADGKFYRLNGQKMWITNAGFADIFIVFAKIDEDKDLSAFIVEKDYPGISLNPEEQKTGLKGSSTRQVFFNDCLVPAENLLSARGTGFKMALNILNLGRIKLGAVALGYAKSVITHSVHYANEREQFGHPIARFGAIRYKLAEQAIRAYASESAIYRVSQHIEDAMQSLITEGMAPSEAKLKATEAFAVEAAMIKVHATEVLDFVVDEGVQIYGGMGYSAETPMDRAYRDSRVYRIFEGTNEINRTVIVNMLLKRAKKGQLDVMETAQKIVSGLMDLPISDEADLFTVERGHVASFKKAFLLVFGAVVQKLGDTLDEDQEILLYLADLLMDTFVSESVLLRVEKLAAQRGEAQIREQMDMMQVYIRDAADRIFKAGKEALNAFAADEELDTLVAGLKRYTQTKALNTTAARRRIATKLITENVYCF